ncbi:MAG: hypothetical protein IBX55_00265 [Methyloprofundus sp.]|nr:hypothetical protein [Methyloprofundus sp.]
MKGLFELQRMDEHGSPDYPVTYVTNYLLVNQLRDQGVCSISPPVFGPRYLNEVCQSEGLMDYRMGLCGGLAAIRLKEEIPADIKAAIEKSFSDHPKMADFFRVSEIELSSAFYRKMLPDCNAKLSYTWF